MANLRCIHCNVNYVYDEARDINNRCPNCRSSVHVVNVDPPPSPSERTKQVGGEHYQGTVQPWDLIKSMESSDDVFVDHARASVIAYVFRVKDGLETLRIDLLKAAHYCEEAARQIEKNLKNK